MAIELNHISVTYGFGENATKALNDFAMVIPNHSMLAVMGKSGSGKTTLLKTMGALLAPDKGEVIIDGESLYRKNVDERCLFRRRNVGFIYQSFDLLPELTVYENIAFPLMLDRKKPDKDFFESICETIGISHLAARYPAELSGGEQQRAAIARAIIHRPKILLCDEPTGNLDAATASLVMDTLCELHKQYQMTSVLITHDPDIASRADRIAVIADGSSNGFAPPPLKDAEA